MEEGHAVPVAGESHGSGRWPWAPQREAHEKTVPEDCSVSTTGWASKDGDCEACRNCSLCGEKGEPYVQDCEACRNCSLCAYAQANSRANLNAQAKESEEPVIQGCSYAALRGRFLRFCRGNIAVLLLTALLFGTITLSQIFAALAANSLALLQDCVSMGVDTITYIGNIFVELKRGSGWEVYLELTVSTISIVLLIFFTQLFLQDAIAIISQQGGAGGEDTNMVIVLIFGLFGLLFDLTCIAAFVWNARRNSLGVKVNMYSAFLHVGSDMLRSSTSVFSAILVLAAGFDSTHTDAVASIVMASIILAGGAAGLVTVLNKARELILSHCHRQAAQQ